MMENTSVLIVEDELVIARGIEQALVQLGFKVTGNVSSGEECLELLESHRADIVLMDINLDGECGIDTAKVIKDKFKIPVIFLTAQSDTTTLNKAKSAEPFGYIVKPYKNDDLSTAIEMALYKFSQNEASNLKQERLTQTFSFIDDSIININCEYSLEFMTDSARKLIGTELFNTKDPTHIHQVVSFYTLKGEKIPYGYFFNHSSEVSGERVHCKFIKRDDDRKLYVRTQRIISNNSIVGWVLVFSEDENSQPEVEEKHISIVSGDCAPNASWIFAKKGKRYVRVDFKEILWIESLDNYVILNTANEKFIIHTTLKSAQDLLPKDDFLKIHRSFLVRLDKIEAWEEGSVIIGDKYLVVSKSHQEAVKEKLLLL